MAVGGAQALQLNREAEAVAPPSLARMPRAAAWAWQRSSSLALWMAAHTVAAAASCSCCDGSYGLCRKVTREQSKCSLGAAACGLGCKAIIANNARYFNFEREAAAAAALDMAAAGRCEQMMREQLTRLARAEEWKGWMQKRRAAAGGGCRLHCADTSSCRGNGQLQARVRVDV